MGFNFYNLGCLNPCRVEHGNIIVRYLSTGEEVTYRSTLDVTIPEQSNFYLADIVLFYLKHEGKQYIGRGDGRITILDENDMLLSLQSWQAPTKPVLFEVGVWRSDVRYSGKILMPTTGEVAYAVGLHAEADMRKHNLNLLEYNPFDVEYSVVAFSMIPRGFCMFVEGGKNYGDDTWVLQTDAWQSDILNLL